MREIVFTHSGNLGDILFSLHFISNGALTYGPCVVHPLGGECDVVQTIEQSVRLPGFLFE